jgi:hypothetical protein
MADKTAPPDVQSDALAAPTPPKRGPGHRGAEVKDTVAEMAAKAHEISLEAGSRMAAAMKDVINAAAGITGFVLESARDLVQYMVRRGQMTQEEADKLIRQAEEAQANRPKVAPAPKAVSAPAVPASPIEGEEEPAAPAAKTASKTAAKKTSTTKAKSASKTEKKAEPEESAEVAASGTKATKKTAAKTTAAKKSSTKKK